MKFISPKLLIIICFQFVAGLSLSGQILQYDKATSTFTVLCPPPASIPAFVNGQEGAWKYFWVMGRNYWEITKTNKLVYCFEEGEEAHVYVRLIPLYSTAKTKKVSKLFPHHEINHSCYPAKSPVLQTTDYLNPNPSDENLVANSETELAVSYKLPNTVSAQTDGGVIVAFYNKKEDVKRLRFPPFKNDLKMLPTRDGNVEKVNPQLLNRHRLRSSAIQQIEKLRTEYDGVACYQVDALNKNEENNLVLTFIPSASFDYKKIPRKRHETEFTTDVQIVWLPYHYEFTKTKMQQEQVFKLEYVIDPNKLKHIDPQGPAYYLGERTELTYELQFENKGQGFAKHVEGEISFTEAKNLDPSSIIPLENSLDCPICPTDYSLENVRYQDRTCLFVDKSKIDKENKVVFHFRNINLVGKREQGARRNFTRGSLLFKINGSKKKQNSHELFATIRFIGDGGDSLQTKVITKNWRHRGISFNLGLKPYQGIRLGNMSGLGEAKSLTDLLNLQIQYKNTPLLTGWGYSGSIRYNEFRDLNLWDAYNVYQTNVPSGKFLFVENTQLQVSNLDIAGSINYRIKGAVELGLGGGLSIPLRGRRTSNWYGFGPSFFNRNVIGQHGLNSCQASDAALVIPGPSPVDSLQVLPTPFLDEQTIIQWGTTSLQGFRTTLNSDFGLLQNQQEDRAISRSTLGWVVNWHAEFGMLNNVSMGFRHEMRFFPKSYRAFVGPNDPNNPYDRESLDLLGPWKTTRLCNFTIFAKVRFYRF